LPGNGDGTFGNLAIYPVGSGPLPLFGPVSLVSGDFDGDGRTDLAVADTFNDDVLVFPGNGDGTFQGAATYAVGARPASLVSGDFDGDGRTDLATANAGSFFFFFNLVPESSTVSVLLGNGDGTFQPRVAYAAGSSPYALAGGDFNGDGRTDLAAAN